MCFMSPNLRFIYAGYVYEIILTRQLPLTYDELVI